MRGISQRSPGPVARFVLRLPGALYRHGLGFLLGRRFLLLVHRGRRTGRTYETVLEVVRAGRDETIVLSGWGERADWFRNVRAAPPQMIVTGRRRFVPSVRFVSTDEGARVLADYARVHPLAWRVLAFLFGWPDILAPDNLRRIAAAHPLVAFRPRSDVPANRGYSTEPTDKGAYTRSFDRVYTRIARAYDVGVRALPWWRGWLRRALAHVEGPRVLEVSFGTGWLLVQCAASFETHGADLNARMVAIARRNLRDSGRRAALVRADVERLPYRDACFDTVVNTMAFTGYPDAVRAMAELRRVLRPEGRLVMIDVNHPADAHRLGAVLVDAWKRAGDLIRDMHQLFEAHGFDATDEEIGGFGSIHLYRATKR